MSSHTTTAWFMPGKDAGLKRLDKLKTFRDPGTVADEVLKYGTIMLTLLLVFTGLLAAFSYTRFFGESLPYPAAVAMAAILTVIIELGKNNAAKWLLRKLFFQGFGPILRTPAETFLFIGLLSVTCATFFVSVYNSTRGSAHLSQMLHREKNVRTFSPKTDQIDASIAAAQERIARNNRNTWKGVVIIESQRTNKRESQLLASLHEQRAKSIETQRADFERERAATDQQGAFTASALLAAGGWVELLQILLLIVCRAAERILDTRIATSAPSPAPAKPAPGYAPVHSGNPPGFRVDYPGSNAAGPILQAPGTPTPAEKYPPGRVVIQGFRPPGPEQEETLGDVCHTVPQTHSLPLAESDDSVERWLTELKREPSNFRNTRADKRTVTRRIHMKLSKIEEVLVRAEGLSFNIAQKTAIYIIKTVVPALQEHGQKTYDTTIIIQRLHALCGAKALEQDEE